jgi:hypothetical protein
MQIEIRFRWKAENSELVEDVVFSRVCREIFLYVREELNVQLAKPSYTSYLP